jgi:hypothetical protein
MQHMRILYATKKRNKFASQFLCGIFCNSFDILDSEKVNDYEVFVLACGLHYPKA